MAKNKNGKLWVICGKCGSGDLHYIRSDIDQEGNDCSALRCRDCATVFFLDELKKE